MVLLAHAKHAPCPYHRRSASLAEKESARSAILGTRTSRDPRILNVVSAALIASLMILKKVLTQMMMHDVESDQHTTPNAHGSIVVKWLASQLRYAKQ